MLSHIPQDQPGFVDWTSCLPSAGTDLFILGLGKDPCLLGMFPVMRVSSKQKVELPNQVLRLEFGEKWGAMFVVCVAFTGASLQVSHS
jgi:hypothetical protein